MAETDEILDEIKAIYKKYDVGGGIIVIDPDHLSFDLEIEPSWAGTRIMTTEKGTRAIHLKLRKDELDRATWTTHLVLSIRDVCIRWGHGMQDLAEMIERHAKVDHVPFWARKDKQ